MKKKIVACLGSSSGEEGDPLYDAMMQVGKLLAESATVVITGGFGGVGMEAPAKGAQEAGGATVGYTFMGLPANPHFSEVVDCGADSSSPEIQFGIRLGHLLSADGFVIGANGGTGTLMELLGIINMNAKFWPKPKKTAILTTADSCWNSEMLTQICRWCSVPEDGLCSIKFVAESHEAVEWVLS